MAHEKTHKLQNPDIYRKYYGHTSLSSKPNKWIPIKRRRKKTAIPGHAGGPVKLNPAYVEWKEEQKEKISKIKFNKYLKKKQIINN